ncbi:PAS domain S-box protein [bacterium]|nr:PAS domain S-box protein [bacterium]
MQNKMLISLDSLLAINFLFLAMALTVVVIYAYRQKILSQRLDFLRKKAEKYQKLFETTTEGVFRCSHTGEVMLINKSGAKILGFDDEAQLLEQTSNIKSFVADQSELESITHRMRSKGSVNHRIIHIHCADKDVKYIEISLHRQMEDDIQIYEGIFRDVTQRMALEAELEAYKERLEGLVSQRTRQLEDVNQTLQKRETQLKLLTDQQVRIQEDERKHIAHVLHDEAGQLLNATKLDLDLLENELKGHDLPQAKRLLEDAAEIISKIIDSIHELSLDLRPMMLDDLGLGPTLSWFVKRYEERLQIPIHLEITGDHKRIIPDISTTLYRITQEALHNVAKYANATRVDISLIIDKTIHLEIKDDGIGFDADTVFNMNMNTQKMGVIGIREKTVSFHGKFELHTEPEQGTCLKIDIPIGDE